MKKNATYNEIPSLLSKRSEFEGNSMSARFDGAGIYTVLSYSTPIATVHHETGVWISETKYSRTTSRHQNLCKAWL